MTNCDKYSQLIQDVKIVFSLKVNSSKLVYCPNDFSHRIPASRLHKHLSVCQYKAKGIKPQVQYNCMYVYEVKVTCKSYNPSGPLLPELIPVSVA